MKKMKFIPFCLMAMLVVTLFMISCEQEKSFELAPTEVVNFQDEEAVVFTLTAELEELSEEELTAYLESLTEAEMEELTRSSPNESAYPRSSCGNWVNYGGTSCHFSWSCSSRKGKYRYQRRWCGPPSYGAYEYRKIRIGCC